MGSGWRGAGYNKSYTKVVYVISTGIVLLHVAMQQYLNRSNITIISLD